MTKVDFVPVEEMLPKRALRQMSQRNQVRAEYESYIQALSPGQAGKFTLEKGDKVSLIRDRLRSAAKRLDRKIQLRKKGGALYFRLRDEGSPADARDDHAETRDNEQHGFEGSEIVIASS